MMTIPSRLRRLEDALFALPDDCMLLSDVDGYLTALLLCPEPMAPEEWLPVIWGGADAEPPFDDPLDVQDFRAMLVARHAEIARDLGRGKFRPFFEVDARNGEVLWEPWIAGFATAMDLRTESWALIDGLAGEALASLRTLVEIADDTTELMSSEVNAICDGAAARIAGYVAVVQTWRAAHGAPMREPPAAAPKIGRNDPCPCGSGKKYKKCCGAT
ncbi:UPF0149 family protein [Sphingomonas sp. PB2P19]|uniref:UPF0149 family protein n=1 Tax=Sphingomonas rhamnosi TaxID=3096156 RepID=UPI002FC90212